MMIPQLANSAPGAIAAGDLRGQLCPAAVIVVVAKRDQVGGQREDAGVARGRPGGGALIGQHPDAVTVAEDLVGRPTGRARTTASIRPLVVLDSTLSSAALSSAGLSCVGGRPDGRSPIMRRARIAVVREQRETSSRSTVRGCPAGIADASAHHRGWRRGR